MREPFSANGTETQTNWNAINWRKANRTVRNLRQRLFRATQEGNLKKVRSLQKLMLKSYSNLLGKPSSRERVMDFDQAEAVMMPSRKSTSWLDLTRPRSGCSMPTSKAPSTTSRTTTC